MIRKVIPKPTPARERKIDKEMPILTHHVPVIGRVFLRDVRKLLPKWLAPLVERIQALEKGSPASPLNKGTREIVKRHISQLATIESRLNHLSERVAEQAKERR